MAELISDETVVVKENDSFVVTRTMKEKFDAEEYLRRIDQVEAKIEMNQQQEKDLTEVVSKFGVLRGEAKLVRDCQKKLVEKEVKNASDD